MLRHQSFTIPPTLFLSVFFDKLCHCHIRYLSKPTNQNQIIRPRQAQTTVMLLASLFFITTSLVSSQLLPPMSHGESASLGATGTGVEFVARLCVTGRDYPECLNMSNALNGTLLCVRGKDKYDCMRSIVDDQADIVNLNSEELYLAGRLYNLEPFAMEQYSDDTEHFKSVAVINSQAQISSIADLKGKRSCHGSLNSTFGWDVPVGLLLATLTMQPDCRGELHTVSKFFEQSCAPEKQYPNLCASCQNSSLCSINDEFYGEDGALRCLFNNFGHVAFTSHQSVQKFLSTNRLDSRILGNYQYLCLDGSRKPLDQAPCEWAHKPTNAFVIKPNRGNNKDIYLAFLRQVFARFVPFKPSWFKMSSFLSNSNKVTQIIAVPWHLQHWDKYLGNYISSVEKPLPGCDPNNVTICTHNIYEELKCLDLQKAAFSCRIRPQINCKRQLTIQDCLSSVKRRESDLMSVDLSDLYEAQISTVAALEPIAIAQHVQNDYAIAAVRADSNIKFLHQLAAKRSCHASLGDTSSWLAPLAVLTERLQIDQRSCNKAELMASYFSASCVPGAADLRVNHFKSGWDKLCSLCKGNIADFDTDTSNFNGLHHCERSPSEIYFGETGALRCLVEGTGDVAFMSSSTLVNNVDGKSKLSWAANWPLALNSRNFKLICRDGPSMPLGNFEMCHLATMPSKIIVSTNKATREEKINFRRLLVALAEKFGKNAPYSSMFEMFESHHNESNLLFNDNTQHFIPLRLDMSNFDMLIHQYFDTSFQSLSPLTRPNICKFDPVTGGSASAFIFANTVTLILYPFILEFIFLFFY